MKMLRITVKILYLFSVFWIAYGEEYDAVEDIEISTLMYDSQRTETPTDYFIRKNVDKLIAKIEEISRAAEKNRKDGLIELNGRLNDEMTAKFGDILDMMTNPNNAYEFLKVKGLDRIVITNLANTYAPLRKNILVLLKTLFDIAPSTTDAVMPARMIDKVVDVLEKDDDLSHKARVIDILHMWLPKNPRVQARLMKGKGLIPFYEQMTKLDVHDLHTLLDLFNKILKEHLEVRTNKSQRSKLDSNEIILYERIGLIEHISRKDVCNGLLNIFRDTWVSVSRENDIVIPVLDLSMKIAPFCLNSFKGKAKAEELFDAYLKFLKETDKKEYFSKFGLNSTNMESVLTDYTNSLKEGVKDEF